MRMVLIAAACLLAAPADAGDAKIGREKAAQCKTCHGIDGVARMAQAPHIAGENEIYLVSQLKAFRSGQRQHQIMSVVAQGLTDEDIADLSAWYASIAFEVTLPDG